MALDVGLIIRGYVEETAFASSQCFEELYSSQVPMRIIELAYLEK